ncbi:5-oxoprolinase subunit PxpB [Halobacillus litoralis]|uniref:5-oxoprolinase subunit PxpB n=1 Tax=Halobacillus litoralis TaxID=45668 RepID=A0A845E530_9BACI|nr:MULTISPECIES: 5-oxoprolinase subunit PxpB [Halobacillus]MYL21327.1 5-oxoprolinase subunit PxpB [Halobacillus litoralis]MYL30229.1 5-oxoprolinase subunit PxpB [Halobacillus halophilus]MYL38220.1 5-oxoprolinase subunit PxpB [Halobacillus litoralis]
MDWTLHPLGDQAVLIEFGNEISEEINHTVQTAASSLDDWQPEWMVEYIPAFTTVTLFYDPLYIANHKTSQNQLPYDWVHQQVSEFLSTLTIKETGPARTVEIPVCYGGDLGPDLSYVAEKNGLTEEEVIERHMNGNYLVYMIGFAPGFPYIGGMDPAIAAPRRKDPRLKIPAGTVGIAGAQTGVYPLETPGGWQLIGRTPSKMFDPSNEEAPTLLQAGDRIQFRRITEEEYENLKEGGA